jgi:hypothetical protein
MQKVFRSSMKQLFREFLIIFTAGTAIIIFIPLLIEAFVDRETGKALWSAINDKGLTSFNASILFVLFSALIITDVYFSFFKHNIIFFVTDDNVTMRHSMGSIIFTLQHTQYYFSNGNKARHIRAIEKRNNKWTDYKCTNFDDETFNALIEYAKSKDLS